MKLPIRPVVQPAVLAGQRNGYLDPAILVSTPGLAGGVPVRLVMSAARCWRALAGTLAAQGHILKATSLYDSYRPYEVQDRTFRARCTTTPRAGVPAQWWQGQAWYLRPGYAPVAVPGTSNHGRGLAIDCGEERDGDTGVESIDADTLAALVAIEESYGYSHELQVEPWHIRCFIGDKIPAAVLEFEREIDMQLSDELSNGMTVNNALVTLLARAPWDLIARLDAILAAAKDDGDTTVVLAPEALAELQAIRNAVTALPTDVADQLAGRLAG